MGQLETVDTTYETRELAWELQQPIPTSSESSFSSITPPDLRSALRMANMAEKDLMKRPALRPLVARHLKRAHRELRAVKNLFLLA